MAQQFNSIAPTTELEAVNALLVASGQTPITQDALDTPATDDIQIAVDTVRRVMHEALTQGWRFNARLGLQVSPSGTYTWTDADGTVTPLNIFKRPAAALAWTPTKTWPNDGIDLVEAISLRYTESALAVLVLFDRTRNRDGIDAAKYPYLYIDLVSAVDFEKCPSSFRTYIVAEATYEFVLDSTGLDKPALQQRAARAYGALVREQGIKEASNLFDDDATAQRMLGYRQTAGGFSRTIFRQ